jgi:DNA polymerase-3 subunit delta'
MHFDSFIGQERWQRYFTQVLSEGRLAPAYLFSGPRHLGKRTFAALLTRAILCAASHQGAPCSSCASCLAWRGTVHPDVLNLRLGKEASSIGVGEVRNFIAALQLTPAVAARRVAVVGDLNRVTAEGLGALLKTLEEPPGSVVLLLLAESLPQLPPTVRSRLQLVTFSPVPRPVLSAALQDRGASHRSAEDLAALASGRPGLALSWHDRPEELRRYREVGERFLALCQGSLGDRFAATEALAGAAGPPLLALRDLLGHWLLLLRDVLLVGLNEPRLLTNSAERPALTALAAKREPARWLAVYRALEAAEQALSRNANRRLALNAFFLNF